MLSEIFSIPFLICLSISILFIGCSSIYFYQRITQQDHKIESMVSLISSMAEELKGGQPQVKQFVPTQLPVQIPISTKTSTLIPVSDGEESETDAEDSESETDSDDIDDSSTYSDSDDENHIIEIMGSVEDLKEMDESEMEELEMEKIEIEECEIEESNTDNIKSIHLEDSFGDRSLFKSIHISGAESDILTDSITIEESTNYKKMPIQKLREIAQVQGHGDVSKLKKNELLKLLGVE